MVIGGIPPGRLYACTVRWFVVGLISLFLGSPISVTLDQDPLPTVRLSVDLPDQETLVNPSGLTLRTTVSDPVGLRVEVFEEGNPDSPVSVDDPANLLMIHQIDTDVAVQLGDMKEVSPGTYEATYMFTSPGNFIIRMLPDIQDRSRLTSESTDEVRFEVQAEPTSNSSPSVGLLVGGIGLAALVGLLVFVGTRGRPRSPKPPVAHDTWWNSP